MINLKLHLVVFHFAQKHPCNPLGVSIVLLQDDGISAVLLLSTPVMNALSIPVALFQPAHVQELHVSVAVTAPPSDLWLCHQERFCTSPGTRKAQGSRFVYCIIQQHDFIVQLDQLPLSVLAHQSGLCRICDIPQIYVVFLYDLWISSAALPMILCHSYNRLHVSMNYTHVSNYIHRSDTSHTKIILFDTNMKLLYLFIIFCLYMFFLITCHYLSRFCVSWMKLLSGWLVLMSLSANSSQVCILSSPTSSCFKNTSNLPRSCYHETRGA